MDRAAPMPPSRQILPSRSGEVVRSLQNDVHYKLSNWQVTAHRMGDGGANPLGERARPGRQPSSRSPGRVAGCATTSPVRTASLPHLAGAPRPAADIPARCGEGAARCRSRPCTFRHDVTVAKILRCPKVAQRCTAACHQPTIPCTLIAFPARLDCRFFRSVLPPGRCGAGRKRANVMGNTDSFSYRGGHPCIDSSHVAKTARC